MAEAVTYLYHVEVAPGLSYDCVGEETLGLAPGEVVIVKCDRYQDNGTVASCAVSSQVDVDQLQRQRSQQLRGRHIEGQRLPEILRIATEEDRRRIQENEERAAAMHATARERIAAHKLDMKLIHSRASFDGRLAVFLFSAEGRVDFRELLRDLSHQFRTRVELRQVGVRDEAAIQGGIGPCGRPFCCATFLRQFSSINVKMAKMQGLSLNPANISGACGRLKCCLGYEAEQYREQYERSRSEAKAARAAGQSPPAAGQSPPAAGQSPPAADNGDGRQGRDGGEAGRAPAPVASTVGPGSPAADSRSTPPRGRR